MALAALAVVSGPTIARGQSNPEPSVLTLDLTQGTTMWWRSDSGTARPPGLPDWVQGVDQLNGQLDSAGWQGLEADADVETSISLEVDRQILVGDLALTLSFSRQQPCDFSIQLFDPDNRIVAVDLFGNVSDNSVAAGTDTCIIPLSRYPSASRISIRQLSGRLVLHGLLAFPVLSELPADPEAERSIFELVGGELSPESLLFQALTRMTAQNASAGTDSADEKKDIASMKAATLKDLEQTREAFAKRLIGTEWLLRDVYRPRLARFGKDGLMIQQHVEPGAPLQWDDAQPQLGRQYRVVGANLVQFGIGGWLANFNENFTEVTYSNTSGGQWSGKLIGTFDANALVYRRAAIPSYPKEVSDRSPAQLESALRGRLWRVEEFRNQRFEDSYVIRFSENGLVEQWDIGNRWESFARYRVSSGNALHFGRLACELFFAPDLSGFAGATSAGDVTVVGEAFNPARLPAPQTPPTPPGVIGSVESMIEAIPLTELGALLNPDTNAAALPRVNAILRATFLNRPAQFDLRVSGTRKLDGKGVLSIRDWNAPLNTRSAVIPLRMIHAYFTDTSGFDPNALEKGSTITVRGRVSRCDFVMSDGRAKFCLDVQESQIIQP